MEEKFCPSCLTPIVDRIPPCPLQCMSPKCKAYQKRILLNVQAKPIIWILGGPGSGKGTQCEKIVAKYGFTHLSSGDLLRYEVTSGSDRAKCLDSIMKRGGLVPNDIVLDLIKEAIVKHEPTSNGFLIDGYPREKFQGIAFEKAIAPVTAIIYFEASRETLVKRLLGRAAESNRVDDNEATINLRIQTFLKNNQLVLDQYTSKTHRINAEDTKDKIFGDVVKVLDPIAEKAKNAVAAVVPS